MKNTKTAKIRKIYEMNEVGNGLDRSLPFILALRLKLLYKDQNKWSCCTKKFTYNILICKFKISTIYCSTYS